MKGIVSLLSLHNIVPYCGFHFNYISIIEIISTEMKILCCLRNFVILICHSHSVDYC